MIRLLVVDDEAKIRLLIRKYAEFEGNEVTEAENGMEAVQLCREKPDRFDLIIMDVMMPELDGFSAVAEIRKVCRTPVLMLSARGEEYDKIHGFELGVDDYVVKPFDPRELLARIRTVLRRASDKGQAAAQSDIRRFAGWTLNVRSRELSQGDERIALSDAMYRLLLVFLDEPFAVLSREYLLRQTQGRDADVFDRSVDIQVSRLRGVLKDTGTSKIIKTVRGGGYMLSVDVEHDA